MGKSVVVVTAIVALFYADRAQAAAPAPQHLEEMAEQSRVLLKMDRELQERLRNESADRRWAPATERSLRRYLAAMPNGKAVRVDCRATICLLTMPKSGVVSDDAMVNVLSRKGAGALSETFFVRNSSTKTVERVWASRAGTKLFASR